MKRYTTENGRLVDVKDCIRIQMTLDGIKKYCTIIISEDIIPYLLRNLAIFPIVTEEEIIKDYFQKSTNLIKDTISKLEEINDQKNSEPTDQDCLFKRIYAIYNHYPIVQENSILGNKLMS